MKAWLLILVTAMADGSIKTEHVATYDDLPRCEYSATARKLYFPNAYNKKFVCLQELIQSEHKETN
tara:strand:+ start:1105 stop:1302 length:198 start_codon:yes stop_codon:yes gene_type:complete